MASWRTSGDAGRTVGTALARRPQIGEHMVARRAVVQHARRQQSRPPGYREESDEASTTEGNGGGDGRWRAAPDGLAETALWRRARATWCRTDPAQAAARRHYFASSKSMCREPGRPAEAKHAASIVARLASTLLFKTETVGETVTVCGNVTGGGLTAACTLRRMPASLPEEDGAAGGEAVGTDLGGGGVLSLAATPAKNVTVGGDATDGGLTAACTLRRMPASPTEVDGAAGGNHRSPFHAWGV